MGVPRQDVSGLCTALAALALACGCDTAPSPKLSFGLTPKTHVDFPITRDAVHAIGREAVDGAISCDSCHGAEGAFTQFRCVGCHEHRKEGLDPDGSIGMNDVHRSVAEYRYASGACLRCHANGLAAELSRAQHDASFPIDEGSAHAAMRCGDCHLDDGHRSQVTCTGCHSDQDADGQFDHDVTVMLSVHGPDMARMGYTWTTAACRGCHARAEVPGVLQHDEAFPIGGGTVHEGKACGDCHVSVQDRAQLACTACHEQLDDGAGARDVHGEERMTEVHVTNTTVTGYSFDGRACFACHQQAQVPGVMQHDGFFPIGAGSAHPLGESIDTPATLVECSTCHRDPDDQRHVTCTSCHAHEQAATDASHSGFPDYLYRSDACVFCHLGGTRQFNHAAAADFPVSTSGDSHRLDDPQTGAVDGLLCSECHVSRTDRAQLSCTSCHQHTVAQEDLDHGTAMGRFGYRYDSAACFQCHATSQVPGLFDHEPVYPLLPPSGKQAHQALQCADCHTSRADRGGSLSCTACHQPTSAQDARDVHGEPRLAQVHAGLPDYAWSAQSCIGCHTDGTAASASDNLDHVWFPIDAGKTHALTASGGQLVCADCHSDANDLQAFDCVQCHLTKNDGDGAGARAVHGEPRMADKHAGVSGFLFSSPECLACHPNGEPAGNFDHTGFPIGDASAHTGIACSDCHTGGAAKTDTGALLCAQCHATVNAAPDSVAAIHNGVPGFVDASPTCLTCHPNAEPVGPMEHAAYFPIDSGSAHATAAYMATVTSTQTSCSACHASRTDRSNDSCASCHAAVAPAPTSSHGSVRGFSNTSPLCKACHGDAQVMLLAQHPKDGTRSWHTHEGATCQNCHIDQSACLADANCFNNGAGGQPNPAATPALRSDKPFAYDFTRFGCLGCHKHKKSSEDSRHADVNGYNGYFSPPCINCHNP